MQLEIEVHLAVQLLLSLGYRGAPAVCVVEHFEKVNKYN